MIVNITTTARGKVQYLDQTLESLFASDGCHLAVNLIVGSFNTSHVERYRKVARLVLWDQRAQWQSIEGAPYHNFNLNLIRSLRYDADADCCLCCEDDVFFEEHWFSELMQTVAEIERKDYVLNLCQDTGSTPGQRYSTHAWEYLCGSQAIFYPNKMIRRAVADFVEKSIKRGIGDMLIGKYAKEHAALYNTTPILVTHIGDVSCFQR